MGTLRSKFNYLGLVINGITLGQPPILAEDLTEPKTISDAFFIWDDSALPTGEISKDGSVVLDETVDLPVE